MPGNCTTDAIFVVRQLREKYRAKGKKVISVVDLEKAFNRVHREVIHSVHKLGISERLISAVMSVCGCRNCGMVIVKFWYWCWYASGFRSRFITACNCYRNNC